MKRAIDVVVASVAIVFLSPLLVALSAAIVIDSRGAPIFSQWRWGRNCVPFRVYKFRTMHPDAEDRSGVRQTEENDVRVTRLGALLRRSNLDELPQLFNVLNGDMSLVGPRCHPIGMLAGGVAYEDLVSNYHERHAIRPGMTGLAQSLGLRGPTTDAGRAVQRIELDLEYVRTAGLWLDLKIVGRTLLNELRCGGSGS